MRGIILAGGLGSRLWPITTVTSKQLLPVYDKPMIYYPIATLMMAGVREILIITTPQDQDSFKALLGDGSSLGVNFEYAIQVKPTGLADALIIGENFLKNDSCLLILGDNIFHGAGLGHELSQVLPNDGCHIFTYEVADPSQYGVLTIDSDGKPIAIQEKPKAPNSNLAVTGLYFFDHEASTRAKNIKPSPRGELEITSLIESYLVESKMTFTKLSRGTAWLDTGNPTSLHDAASFIKVIEDRTGLKIACLEEISWRNGWLTDELLGASILKYGTNHYGSYLKSLLSNR
jgi:glucose-1-phosphate thymidylyltransferase